MEQRMNRELRDFAKNHDGVKLNLLDECNLTRLLGTIPGPSTTPYEGGTFDIDIELTDEYPFKPPKMRFITKVWHPNISNKTGAICLDILRDKWSPALTLKTTLISLQALLSSPEAHDAQDGQVASQYINNREEFLETARLWTRTHAMASLSQGERFSDRYQE